MIDILDTPKWKDIVTFEKFKANVIKPCFDFYQSFSNFVEISTLLNDSAMIGIMLDAMNLIFGEKHIFTSNEDRFGTGLRVKFISFYMNLLTTYSALLNMDIKNIIDFSLVNTNSENRHKESNSQIQRDEDSPMDLNNVNYETLDTGDVSYGNKMNIIKNAIKSTIVLNFEKYAFYFDSLISIYEEMIQYKQYKKEDFPGND